MQLTTTATLVKVYEQESFAKNAIKQRVTIRKDVRSFPAGITADYYDLFVYNNLIDSNRLKDMLGLKVELEITIDSYPVRPRGQQDYRNITTLNLRKICLL
jgi:hypothetical protein